MSCAHNVPGLFKEQRRRSRGTWSATALACGLCGGGGRLLSCDWILDNQTGKKAEQNNHNPTAHYVSLKTEDRNFKARRINIHRILGECSDRRRIGQSGRSRVGRDGKSTTLVGLFYA